MATTKVKCSGNFRSFIGKVYQVSAFKQNIAYQYDIEDDQLAIFAGDRQLTGAKPLKEYCKEDESNFEDIDDFLKYVD